MTTFNKIILSPYLPGRVIEGKISGTPKPGTVVEIKPATEPHAPGRFTFQVYTPGSDGLRPRGALWILLENLRGGGPTDAYVSGEQCQVYAPLPGDQLLMLLANIGGTADAFAIGDLLIPVSGTGKLIATTGTPEIEPFCVRETKAALTADALVEVEYTGY